MECFFLFPFSFPFPRPLRSVCPRVLTHVKSQQCTCAWMGLPALPSWAPVQATELAVIAHQSQVWAVDLEASHSRLSGPSVVMRLLSLTSCTTESVLAVCSFPAFCQLDPLNFLWGRWRFSAQELLGHLPCCVLAGAWLTGLKFT